MKVTQSFHFGKGKSYGSNKFDDNNDIILNFYFKKFEFRKNVSPNTLIKKLLKTFTIELICALAREQRGDGKDDQYYAPCEYMKDACPCLTIYTMM